MAEFSTFKGSSPWPWPWIGSYCIPSCVTHRPLPTNRISLKSKKLFVDGRTYRRAGGHLWPTLLGRLGGVDLNITITTFCNRCQSAYRSGHSTETALLLLLDNIFHAADSGVTRPKWCIWHHWPFNTTWPTQSQLWCYRHGFVMDSVLPSWMQLLDSLGLHCSHSSCLF